MADGSDSTRPILRSVPPPDPSETGEFAPLFTAALEARIAELDRRSKRGPPGARLRRACLIASLHDVHRRAEQIIARQRLCDKRALIIISGHDRPSR